MFIAMASVVVLLISICPGIIIIYEVFDYGEDFSLLIHPIVTFIGIPMLLFLSWKNKQKGNIRLSILFSIIQALILVVTFWFGALLISVVN